MTGNHPEMAFKNRVKWSEPIHFSCRGAVEGGPPQTVLLREGQKTVICLGFPMIPMPGLLNHWIQIYNRPTSIHFKYTHIETNAFAVLLVLQEWPLWSNNPYEVRQQPFQWVIEIEPRADLEALRRIWGHVSGYWKGNLIWATSVMGWPKIPAFSILVRPFTSREVAVECGRHELACLKGFEWLWFLKLFGSIMYCTV